MTLGNMLLWLAAVVTAAGITAYGLALRYDDRYLRAARTAVYLSALSLLAASTCLLYLILSHQFQVSYVFRYSSLDMPHRYLVAAFWGGQEGTFLLWAVWGALLAVLLRFKARQYEAPVLIFYMAITFFLLLMLLRRSPFALLPTVPVDGNGLNPLLQDPWMTIHPPVMFFGFASLGIPAAYAMAALVREDWDTWITRSLPWTILGVLALGTGLTLGGYWSYSILGWGGYWGWDPVENSSLVPWLLAVTLLHSQVIQLKRGRFRRANLVLAMLPFLLLTYSTFLTRSGVLADFSVHSFTNLGINRFLVTFMIVFLSGGLGLFVAKVRRIPVNRERSPQISRDNLMFWGSAAFALFAALVCLGMSAPLLGRIWGTPSSIQPEFYNRAGIPFLILVSLLMATAPRLLWRGGAVRNWKTLFLWSAPAAFALACTFYFLGMHNGLYLLIIATGALALFSNLEVTVAVARKKGIAAGGFLAHVGVGLMILGILASTTMDRSEMIQLQRGVDTEALGYTWRYEGSRPIERGRKTAYDVSVVGGGTETVMSPLMYPAGYADGMMKKPAIKSLLTGDLYIAPGGLQSEPLDHRVSTRLILKRGIPQEARGMVFTFDHFETTVIPGKTKGTGSMEVAAHITVERNGTTVAFTPMTRSAKVGLQAGEPTPIPGTSYKAVLDGVDATNGRIRLDVSLPPLILHEGETGTLGEWNITFHGFDVDMARSNVSVYADVDASRNGAIYTLRPGVLQRMGADRILVETPLGDSGLNLALGEVNAASKEATFFLVRPPAETLWVEVSTKPFILLLWLGTGCVILGLLSAALYRGQLAKRLDRGINNIAETWRKAA